MRKCSLRSRWLRFLWKKHADQDQFFCGSNQYVLCYSDQSIVKFIPGTSIEFTVERDKKEIGKSFSKIYLYLCNVGNADSDVNFKMIDENEVTIHSNWNQTISNQLTHQQNTDTNPTQNTNRPSFLLFEGQKQVRQNPSNERVMKNCYENLFPSINFIQSLTGSYVEDVNRLTKSSVKNKEDPCCSRNINPVIERKMYCPIWNNPFSVSIIEEHADLCLQNKNKLFLRGNQKIVKRKNQQVWLTKKQKWTGI